MYVSYAFGYIPNYNEFSHATNNHNIINYDYIEKKDGIRCVLYNHEK